MNLAPSFEPKMKCSSPMKVSWNRRHFLALLSCEVTTTISSNDGLKCLQCVCNWRTLCYVSNFSCFYDIEGNLKGWWRRAIGWRLALRPAFVLITQPHCMKFASCPRTFLFRYNTLQVISFCFWPFQAIIHTLRRELPCSLGPTRPRAVAQRNRPCSRQENSLSMYHRDTS